MLNSPSSAGSRAAGGGGRGAFMPPTVQPPEITSQGSSGQVSPFSLPASQRAGAGATPRLTSRDSNELVVPTGGIAGGPAGMTVLHVNEMFAADDAPLTGEDEQQPPAQAAQQRQRGGGGDGACVAQAPSPPVSGNNIAPSTAGSL
jgi:hypothetical protein